MNLRDRLRDFMDDDDHKKRHENQDDNAEHGVNDDVKEEDNGSIDKPAP
jgi:hypothetical protein